MARFKEAPKKEGKAKTVWALVGGGLAALVLSLVLGINRSSGRSGFEQGFDKSFRRSCRTTALENGFSDEVAGKYCDCALAKFQKTKSMDKAVVACVAELP